MRFLVLLVLCIVYFCGCSSSEPPQASATPAAETAEAAPDKGKKTAKKPAKGKKPAASAKTTPAPSGTATESSSFADAEAAFAQGSYRTAAVIAQNSLEILRNEDPVPQAEILKRREYIAMCQRKAGMLEASCSNYFELTKLQPKDTKLAETLSAVRKEYWELDLNAKLQEAERLRDRQRFTPALSLTDEVRHLATKAHLKTERIDKVETSIRQAQLASGKEGKKQPLAANDQPAPKAKPKAAPKRKPKPSAKPKSKITDEGSSYPTSGK